MLTSYQNLGHYGTAPTMATASARSQPTPNMRIRPHHRHIWIITGPAGCGKSTVAKHLADSLDFPYIEGDEFHPKANIDKMAAGIPLTDADRWDWLIALREQSVAALRTGASGVVLTCSALKKKYRDVIRIASYNDEHVLVHFVYLAASEETLLARVKARQGHYMKDSMVKSQFNSLEEPKADEHDVLSIDVSGSLAEVQKLALGLVSKAMADDATKNSS